MEPIKVKEIVEAVGGKLLCGDGEVIVNNVCIDSRAVGEGSLFVPIIGERVDAHKFVRQVFESGAAAAFTSSGEITDASKPHILVDNTEKALGALSVHYKSRYQIPVIGITGSVGKTSTKEMIAAALATKYNVLKTAGNQNSNIGVPLTLFRIESEHEIAVIEMGISDFDEMGELADFVHPDTAVVTNIGVAHLAQFKTRENIMGEKLMIARHFGKDNVLYLNGDNDMLAKAFVISKESPRTSSEITNAPLGMRTGAMGRMMPDSDRAWRGNLEKQDSFPEEEGVFKVACDAIKINCPQQIHYFGTDTAMDFHAENVHIKDGRQCFTFVGGGHRTEVSMLQLGLHTVYNAVVALAIAMQYGIEPEVAKAGVENYAGIAMRQQVNHMRDGIKIIDDTYNASPDSIKSCIDVLESMDNSGRKIASLGDVLELGETSWQCHYDTGVHIAGHKVDEVVTVGEMMKALVKGINDTNPNIVTHAFDTNAEAAEYIKTMLGAGDALICKGSRGMHQEEIVEAVKEYFK